jgi:hypothetical protein
MNLKPHHMRNRTDVHIPITLIGVLKVKAKELMNTDQKVSLELERGGQLLLEPLFLTLAGLPAIAERLDTFMTREEIHAKEKEIKESHALIKELTMGLIKNGKANEIQTILEKVKSGEMNLDQLRTYVELLKPEEEVREAAVESLNEKIEESIINGDQTRVEGSTNEQS